MIDQLLGWFPGIPPGCVCAYRLHTEPDDTRRWYRTDIPPTFACTADHGDVRDEPDGPGKACFTRQLAAVR